MAERMWRQHDLNKTYDVVIIGGGGHGLATAYYLTKLGVRNIAVLEAKYIGHGGSGRNTAILRSNYRTEAGVAFFDESLKLFENLAGELDINLMFSQQGHFTLGHATSTMNVFTTRAELNKVMGVDSTILSPPEIKKMLPEIDITDHPRYPIMGALYHPPGGIIRHDAVVWGYARAADRGGVHIHNMTPALEIQIENGRVTGVVTPRGTIRCGKVVTALAGWTSTVVGEMGIRLPLVTHPLQAMVSESYKPWLHHVVVSANLHMYMTQTDRGELVCGAGIDGYPHYGMRSTLGFLEGFASHALELFPILHNVKVQRQWAGLCDMTPDYSPIISPIDEVGGFYVNCGWGTYGFKATPASGLNTAKMIANEEVPENIRAFHYNRFRNNDLVGEKASAAVGT